MKYDVTIARYGSVTIEAESPEDAMARARKLGTDEIAWSSDWEPTDADPSEDGEDDPVPEKPKRIAFFDMDGTIAAPLFRTDENVLTDGFPPQDWIKFCTDRGYKAYELCPAMEPVLDFAKRLKDAGYELRVLTIAMSEGEKVGKVTWKHNHPDVDALFDSVIFASDANAKLDEIEAAGPGTVLVNDDLVLLLRAKALGATTVHVSHVYTGTADKLVGLAVNDPADPAPAATDYIADAARQAAACNNVCFMANGKNEAQRAFWTWRSMGVENAFILTAATPRRELEMSVKAIKQLQAAGKPVHVACTPMLETGVDLDFEDFYREAASESHLAQASGRHNRYGKYEPRPMRIFRDNGPMELREPTRFQAPETETPVEGATGSMHAPTMDDVVRTAEAMAGAAGEALVDAKNAVADMARQAAGSDAAKAAKAQLSSAMHKAADSAAAKAAKDKLSGAMRKAADFLDKR